MFCVYILRSRKTTRYYVGSTHNVMERVSEHNCGKTLSTQNGVPWDLVHVESFESRSEAVRRERKIKARGMARYLESLK